MANDAVPIEFDALLKTEADDSCTLAVRLSGIPDTETALRLAEWLRMAIRDTGTLSVAGGEPPKTGRLN